MSPTDAPPAKVIDLQARRLTNFRYREWLRCARTHLDGLDDALFEDAVQLALAGPWREWADAQPVGGTTTFSEEMLLASGDPNVHTLVLLARVVRATRETLETPKGPRPR
jgi:hypothetical protein